LLLLSIIPLCANIDARIEAIQNAPVEERYILMNAFKKEVVHMQETERIDAITKLRSITQSRHSDRAIKELQRHTKPRHSRSREILSKTKERTEKQFTQENEAEDHIEDETEDHIEDETEDHIEDETEDHIENETEDHIENETEDHIEDETEDHIENETEDHIEDETEDHIEDETEDHIEDETEDHIEDEHDDD
jgi:hypothetical protein